MARLRARSTLATDIRSLPVTDVTTAVDNLVGEDGAAMPALAKGPAMRLYRAARLLALPPTPSNPKIEAVAPRPSPEAPTVQTKPAKEVIGQGDESSFPLLDTKAIIELREVHVKTTGGDPEPACRPTADQISALRHRLAQGRTPYVDLALFGPYGDRISKGVKHTAQVFVDGELRTKMVSGPSNYEALVAAWTVFRATMIMLGAASPATLDTRPADASP